MKGQPFGQRKRKIFWNNNFFSKSPKALKKSYLVACPKRRNSFSNLAYNSRALMPRREG